MQLFYCGAANNLRRYSYSWIKIYRLSLVGAAWSTLDKSLPVSEKGLA